MHTPGPWKAACPSNYDSDGIGVFAKNAAGLNYYIAKAHFMGTADTSQADANARLIAAAPELLYALDALASIREELRLAEGLPPGRVLYVDRLYREAEAAIAKARG